MSEKDQNEVIQKVDNLEKVVQQLVHLIEGDGSDAPGMKGRLGMMERILYGKQSDGLVHKVNVMWRINLWVWCTLSGLAGFVLHSIVSKIAAHI